MAMLAINHQSSPFCFFKTKLVLNEAARCNSAPLSVLVDQNPDREMSIEVHCAEVIKRGVQNASDNGVEAKRKRMLRYFSSFDNQDKEQSAQQYDLSLLVYLSEEQAVS